MQRGGGGELDLDGALSCNRGEMPFVVPLWADSPSTPATVNGRRYSPPPLPRPLSQHHQLQP